MSDADRDALIEQSISSFLERDLQGRPVPPPAWFDLPVEVLDVVLGPVGLIGLSSALFSPSEGSIVTSAGTSLIRRSKRGSYGPTACRPASPVLGIPMPDLGSSQWIDVLR